MIKLEKNIMPKGFFCASKNCGLKEKDNDLSVIYTEKIANAAGVFTQNQFPGAPIIVGREIIKKGKLNAIVVNSKISNVATGEQGISNAKRMADATANEFAISADKVIMSSTGVIAKQLPIELIENGIVGISNNMTQDPIVAAKGIMTTDTYPKAISYKLNDVTITVIGKGSGMIEPNMATMLVYILTDAEIASETLDSLLRSSVSKSFNMLSIDTDTSTSDTCLILANGLAGKVDIAEFAKVLDEACIEMTKMLAKDGEGATKLLTATVKNAKNKDEAKYIAKALINSPLIKTMAYGADPNIGRIMMAVGKCFDCEIIPEKMKVSINNCAVYANLDYVNFDEDKVRKLLSGDLVEIEVDLGIGADSAIAYGCDLTEGYIKENAAYYSS